MHNPVGFCRNLGVNIGESSQIMGTHHPFGTEPYLVTIGNHVRINDGVQFITHDGSVWVIRSMPELAKNDDIQLSDVDLFGRIVVGDNVQIGSHAMIMPGVTIGSNVVIGAGAIVTKNVPDNCVVAGIPARVIESIDEYYKKNKELFVHTKHLNESAKREFLENHYVGKGN